jgi:hypothetical protein
MGRVDGLDAAALPLQAACRKPRIGAALGAVAVQNLSIECCRKAQYAAISPPIAEPQLPRHRNARHPERAGIRQALQGAFA